MIKNYLKITWAVMKRRKFYTFISLFGISLTLTILILLSAFFKSFLAPDYPEGKNRDRTLYISSIRELNRKEQGSWQNALSLNFVNTFIRTLPSPEKVAVTTLPNSTNTYVNGRPDNYDFRYTDAAFWEITDFEFLEGKAFTAETIKNNEQVTIISDAFRDRHFGKGASVVGKQLEIGKTMTRVVGVVRGVPFTQLYTGSEVYYPINMDNTPPSTHYNGNFFVFILAKSAADVPKVKAEFAAMMPKVPILPHGDFKPDTLIVNPEIYAASVTRSIAGTDDDNGLSTFLTVVTLFAFLFMLLPALNLVNINVSRIMERASEIGIRKAFGGSIRDLTLQFIIENILLTAAGCVIALVLSAGIMQILNENGVGPLKTLSLSINWTVVGIATVLSLVFGLMSGVLPAYRMAKLPIAEALKA
jgi:putative ABC transport system permease protein